MPRIVFGTDGSHGAAVAERLVGSISWPPHSVIDVVTVLPASADLAVSAARWSGIAADSEAVQIESARAAGSGAAERLQAALPACEIDWRVARGQPADVIARLAAQSEATLIVAGSRGQGAIEGALAGSVATALADRAQCPVLVARTEHLRRTLVAEDGSAGASLALEYLCANPWLLGRETRVTAVLPTPEPWGESFDLPVDPRWAQMIVDDRSETWRATQERLNARAQDLRWAAGRAVDCGVVEGQPGAAIVQAASAWHADLVVVGNRRQAPGSRFGFGSVGRHVLHHAECSVLIVGPVSTQRRSGANAGPPLAAVAR